MPASHHHDHHHGEQHGALDPEAYAAAVNQQRAEKDQFFGTSRQSPIPLAERRSGFHGLRYYPPRLAYRVVAEIVPLPQPEMVMLGTTQGDVRPQLRYAELRFTLDGEPCQLIAYKDAEADPGEPGELFVPFRDATTGTETYGAGRYIEAEEHITADGQRDCVVDFNLAYSPWCAYNDAYSCILPPAENRLNVSVRAGERTYHEDH